MKADDSKVVRAGEEAHKMVNALVKDAVMSTGTRSAPDAVFITSMGALAANMAGAIALAKRPDWLIKATEHGPNEDNTTTEFFRRANAVLSTQEAVIYAALLGAYTMDHLDEDGNFRSSFGPPKLWRALQAWSRIFPDRRADDFLDSKLLEAARICGKDIESPFSDFLTKRVTHNSPDSLN